MKVSEIKYEDLTQDIVDKILFDGIEEKNVNGDCIMVLGSSGAIKHKIPKAAEMYNEKRAKKILYCFSQKNSTATMWRTLVATSVIPA